MTLYCNLHTMILSTRSLHNIQSKNYQELWNVTIPKFSIRLTVTYFHIECQSGTVIEVTDQFLPTVSYTNCKQPPSVLLSESEMIVLMYKVTPKALVPDEHLMKEGFRAHYSPVEIHHHQLLYTMENNVQDKVNTNTTDLLYKACSSTFMKCYFIYTGEQVSWQVAGGECWTRGMTMVSIRSKEELFVVKYMLRTFKNVQVDDQSIPRVFSTNIVDPNYYSHIGLSRIVEADGIRQFVWQDVSPVVFSAWNTDQPGPEGDCVRMSFHLANKNNTWEVEDCYSQRARYFICEEPEDHVPVQDTVSDRCYTTHYPYTGTWSVTHSGRKCQRWDSTYPHTPGPHTDSNFPEGNKSNAENYCRDPSDEGYVWCYTTDPGVRRETCFVQDDKHSTSEAPTHSRYTCTDGNQISSQKRCNGMVDCVDAQDELKCDYKVQKLLKRDTFTNEFGERGHTLFICGSNETISFLAECNGVVDCIDGTDEKNCTKDKTECSNEEIQCGDGRCIHASLMCDFIPHCTDYSDEHCDHPECNSTGEFACKNGQCIPIDYRCNAHKDCVDGSDENTCDSCRKGTFHCDSTKCIPERFVCDGMSDCRDGNDERKCAEAKYSTCNDRWKHGLRKNGNYLLDGIMAECNFDNVQIDGNVSTKFYATAEYKYGDEYVLTTERTKNIMHFQDVCHITFTQRCTLAVQTVAEIEDRHFDNKYQHCRCVALTVIPDRRDRGFVHACDNITQTLDDSLMFITYDSRYRPRLRRKKPYNNYIEIKVGPIICKNELINDVTMLPCGEDGLMYPASRRCIYDIDTAGYILGCRSGSHLKDCSEFTCPDGTIKCPGRYCIPLHYICDGINQCPDNSDEHGCGCNNDDLELILLVHIKDLVDHDHTLRQIVGQFNNPGTIVRIVSYDVDPSRYEDVIPFEHKMLFIEDTVVNNKAVISREYKCSYRILASDYIDRVRFTKNSSSTRGVIILQNGTESESVEQHILQNISKPDFDVYRVVIRSSSNFKHVEDNEYNYVTDITVNNLDILSSTGSKIFPSLCKDSSSNVCQNNYKCSSSKLCITLEKVCDGHVHCPFADDEMFCDFVCPSNCSCSGYNVYCTSAHFGNVTEYRNLMDRRLRVLDLSKNIGIGEFLFTKEKMVPEFPYMIRLNLSECNIKKLATNYFTDLPNLRSLDLGRNKILSIPGRTFYGLTKLVYLNLYGNEGFMAYESFAFSGLVSLRDLIIMDSDITSIAPKTFSGLNPDALQVCKNQIQDIRDNAFGGLTVKTILFESNSITKFDRGLFNGILNITSLKTSAYKYCCIRPDYLPESACLPERDEFSSCDDLMRNSALQTLLWLMGICALLGNILAIIYRIVYDRQRLKLGFGIFVTNLAVADLLMGMYLLIIAVADASFRKRYIFMDEYWRNSVWCTLAGVLSTISSEASVLFLCLITLDRFIVIKFPYSRLRFRPKSASVAALVAWILSVSISVIPLIAKDHFQSKFYAKSGVCIALPLTRDRPPGWLYSVIVFIGVNFVTFIGIAFGQLSIYLEIKNVSSKVKQNRGGKSKAVSRRKELIIARNLLLVVATDFLCWFPIGCMGVMAMSGYLIPGEVYAWVAVFVLPVNSALNPVLYTLTAILGNRKQQDTNSTVRRNIKSRKFMKKVDTEKLLSIFVPKTEKCSSTMISVERIIRQNKEITMDNLLKFTIQLTRCLHLLHKNSMALESLDASSVFVTIEHGKITGDIQIRQQPKQRASYEEKTDNMNQLGVIVHRLMECNSQEN